MIQQIETILNKKIGLTQRLYTILDSVVNVVGATYQEKGVQLDEANEVFLVQLENANIFMAVPAGHDFVTVLVGTNDNRNIRLAELKIDDNFGISEEYKTSDREIKSQIFDLYANIITVIESLKNAMIATDSNNDEETETEAETEPEAVPDPVEENMVEEVAE